MQGAENTGGLGKASGKRGHLREAPESQGGKAPKGAEGGTKFRRADSVIHMPEKCFPNAQLLVTTVTQI